ncbi:MAG: acyltransferase [Bacteroidetes bacterium]|nr:acyltransferase [Bacteroidota bacterium]
MQTSATPQHKVNFKIIDWMRGLASLYVVFNHSRGFLFTTANEFAAKVEPKSSWHWWEKLDFLIMQHSNLSVEFVTLFFLLSGFSIAHSLSNENSKVTAFYGRRMLRLYPTYILGIIWALAVFIIIKDAATDVFARSIEGHLPLDYAYRKFGTFHNLVFNLLYMPVGNYLTPQYWSLPYEVIFYLTIPWFIKRFRLYTIGTVAMFIIGCIMFGALVLDTDDALTVTIFNHQILTFYLPQYFIDFNLFFLIGVLFYRYKDVIIEKYRLSKWVSVALLLVLFEAMVGIKAYKFQNEPNKVTDLIMVAFTFVLIFASLKYSVRIKWLEKIGSFSYTLYVTHVASIFLVKLILYKMGFHFYDIYNLYGWFFGPVAAVPIAWLLYYVAEYPSMYYLKKIRANSKQRREVIEPVTVPALGETATAGMKKTGNL